MENINKYIYSLIITSVVAVIAELIISKNDNGISRYVDLICGLCVAMALIAPVKGGVEWLIRYSDGGIDGIILDHELPPKENYSDIFDLQLQGITEDEICRQICNEFGIDSKNIRINAHFDDSYAPQTINVVLNGKGILKDPTQIIRYINTAFNCQGTVAVE
jgi:hypothetical protein